MTDTNRTFKFRKQAPANWTGELTNDAQRQKLLKVATLTPGQDLKNELAPVKNPQALRRHVLEAMVPHAPADVRIVGAAIDARGGAALHADNPDLAAAVTHEVYETYGDVTPNEKELTVAAARVFDQVEPILYREKVRKTLVAADIQTDDDEVKRVQQRLKQRKIRADSPRFAGEVIATRAEIKADVGYEGLFDQPPNGTKSVRDELGPALSPDRRSEAIRLLRELGVPADATDDDWARIALALTGRARPADRDVLSLASYDPLVGTLGGDFELDFEEFEDPEGAGLSGDNIATCADLYYVHMFDRLGVYRAVDELGVRFFDNLDLGMGDTARRLYVYIKRRGDRIPAEDRQRLTTRIFESDGEGSGTFKLLMGQMVESLIEWRATRSAGELLSTGRVEPSAASRSAVLRSIDHLARYLSRSGGGMSRFLSREAGAQLIECFQILKSDELRSYFGGEFTAGMWSIVEELTDQPDGTADRARTLAVNGRRVVRWVADTARSGGSPTDEDLDVLADHVHQWLAAYRKPELEEPEWLADDEPDDDTIGGRAMRDALDDEAAGDEMEPDVLAEVGP